MSFWGRFSNGHFCPFGPVPERTFQLIFLVAIIARLSANALKNAESILASFVVKLLPIVIARLLASPIKLQLDKAEKHIEYTS